jgi:preprotein translocase SecE subunit
MAKKQSEVTQVEETEQPAKPTKEVSKVKETKKNDKKKEKKPSKTGKRIKETASELKKVTWPTFGSVVKKTGVVLAVILIFAVVLFGIDRLLAWLFDLLTTSVA